MDSTHSWATAPATATATDAISTWKWQSGVASQILDPSKSLMQLECSIQGMAHMEPAAASTADGAATILGSCNQISSEQQQQQQLAVDNYIRTTEARITLHSCYFPCLFSLCRGVCELRTYDRSTLGSRRCLHYKK